VADEQERLKAAQAKVKSFQSSRDQINRDLAIEKHKLQEAYTKLTELGIQNPEQLNSGQLQALADEKRLELAQAMDALEAQLEQAQELMNAYQELQET
jgi:hypothetical protein